MLPNNNIQSFLLCMLCLGTLTMAQNSTVSPPTNPFLDPKNDPYNPLRYIVSNTLTIAAISVVLITALIHTFWLVRYHTKWMLVLVIGEFCYAIGFGCRFALHAQPDSSGIYIAEYLFIVLPACAFIAADYILFTHLVKSLSCDEYVPIPVNGVAIIFVTSDITTFIIQGVGGGSTMSKDPNVVLTASRVFLAGLTLQLASFLVFTGIYARFLYKVYRLRPDVWGRDQGKPWHRDWRTLAGALTVSCTGILVRSAYRVAELSYGFLGFLATTEAYFYLLDTLPLVVANLAYVPCWPGRFIPKDMADHDVEEKAPSNPSTTSALIS